MLGRIACLKLRALTLTEYTPIGSCASRYWPESLEMVVNFCLVCACSAVMVAPGMPPPSASSTRPVISAVFIWASAASAPRSDSAAVFAAKDNQPNLITWAARGVAQVLPFLTVPVLVGQNAILRTGCQSGSLHGACRRLYCPDECAQELAVDQ